MTLHSSTYAVDANTWRPLLKDLGLTESDVMRGAGLPEDLLDASSSRLTSQEFYRLWHIVEAKVGAGPLFPIKICFAVRAESFCPSLFAALCSPNFSVAVNRMALFKRLSAPFRIAVIEEQHQVTLDFVWPESELPPPSSLIIAELLFFVLLARMGTREELRPLRVVTGVELPSPAYHDFFGTNIKHGDRHQLTFSTNDAQRPFLTLNEGIWAAFEPELRNRLALFDSSVTHAQRVKSVLLEVLPTGMISVQHVAERLAMSKRTLQRQLAEEGTTFIKLVQEIRESLALHYLSTPALSITEISFLLGFEEPNSFSRAFRDWTGKTPELARGRTEELRPDLV